MMLKTGMDIRLHMVYACSRQNDIISSYHQTHWTLSIIFWHSTYHDWLAVGWLFLVT